MVAGLDQLEQRFQDAIEAHDWARAQKAVAEYVNRFGSERRSPDEIKHARAVIERALEAAIAARRRLGNELHMLNTVTAGYFRRERCRTLDISL